MAASQHSDRLREELLCSICLEHFTDPVCIDCGHNFCRPCITQCWQGVDADPQCPQCRAQCPGRVLRPNWELGNIAEVIKLSITPQVPPEGADLCPRHQQRLQLFCETDKTPICMVCDKSKEHRGHDVIPVEEAAQEYKVILDSRIKNLKKELEDLQKWTGEGRKTASNLEEKLKNQTGNILGTFEQLQQFLENEKKKLLRQLEYEHKTNMKSVQEKVAELETQQNTHSALITEMEAMCRKQDVELMKFFRIIPKENPFKNSNSYITVTQSPVTLQDVQSILNRCDNVKAQKPGEDVKVVQTLQRFEHVHLQDKLMELKETFPAELDSVFAEFWRLIKTYERVVTLDPDTAHQKLVLSEDGRSVRLGARAQEDLPDTPQRYDTAPCVLGREALSSGRHYWEVEVGDKTAWDLGVCDESASKKGRITLKPEDKYWVVCLRVGGKYYACNSSWTPLTPRTAPRVVGLLLDYEGGRFTAYNAQDRSLLHTFSGVSFSHTLRPFFSPGYNAGALQILLVAGRE